MWVAVGSTLPSSSIAYSYDGTNWISATNIFDEGYGVKWNGRMWVAVGNPNSTFNTRIAYSYDGICWKRPKFVPKFKRFYTIDWNGEIWVVGGEPLPFNTLSLAYSYDGDTWILATINPSPFICYTVVWNGIMWLAGGDNNILCYSYDGINWYQVNLPPGMSIIYTIAWNGSMWVAGGDSSPYISYSYDGQNWENTNINFVGTPNQVNGITWDGNKWLAVGSVGQIYYSYDGLLWTETLVSSGPIYGVAWNSNLGSTYIQQPTICLGSSDLKNSIAYSIDGIKYVGLGNDAYSLFSIGYAAAWNGTMWVAVGTSSLYTIAYSYDGIKWFPIINSYTYFTTGYCVVWTGLNWVVGGAGNSLGLNIYYSPDGINWIPSIFMGIPPSGFDVRGLATDVITIVGGTSSTTVAVGLGANIWYSNDDGINWTQAGGGPGFDLYCVAWNGTTWLTGGITNDLYSSFDGLTWTFAITTGALNINSIAWNGVVWVLVGDNTAGSSQIYWNSSLDGLSVWQLASVFAGAIYDYNTVIWNGKRWIAGGSDPSVPQSYILTSYDGITWFVSPPNSTTNLYKNLVNQEILGLSSNSTIGGVIVDSQIVLNKNNSLNLTTKLDVVSEKYFNNGYNNMTLSISNLN